MKLKSINPSNYQLLGEVEVSTPKEITAKVAQSRKAQPAWSALGVTGRVNCLRQAFGEIAERREEIGRLEALEMGMPITDAIIDVDDSINFAKWYFDNAEKYLAPEITLETATEIHQVFYEPLGVAAVIIPWNFPLANLVWGAVQSLIAGNTVVLKHSEECLLNGKLLEDILTSHLPEGVFSEVYGAGDVGAALANEQIDMIAFTGSTKTGKFLYELAGKKFIKAVMELGGSAPGIVFADADIDVAIGTICANRLYNQGQCCDGLKRLIVEEKVSEETIKKLIKVFASKKIGNAEEKTTEIGPLVAKRQLDLLIAQMEDATAKGATIVTGGHSLEKTLGGAFFEPTIITGITPSMRVWNEEVFGPVLPVHTFKTDDEAIDLANNTSYGLGSYVFTKDCARADRLARELRTGMVSVNGVSYIKPFNPFGGYKNSGFGREHGKYGFLEGTQIKVVAKNK